MKKRAERLSERIEQGFETLAKYAENLSESQWSTVIPPDGRKAGVIIHHVASVYPIEVHIAKEVASGKAIEGITWAVIAEMNAKHAQDYSTVARDETIDLLRRNGRAAAEAVRAFTDSELDCAAGVSLNAVAPLTAQFLIEDHALRHSWHHLAKIKAGLQDV
jgi:hypothetical protein